MAAWHGDHPVTALGEADPSLAAIRRYPVKSLTADAREQATLVAAGGIEGDREWAMVAGPADAPFEPGSADVGGDGEYINGKRTAKVHRLASTYVPRADGGPALRIRRREDPSDEQVVFPLYDGRPVENPAGEADVHADLNDWLSDYFDQPVSVRWHGGGQQDDRKRHGPTIVSTATLREVAAWFDFDVASARRRFRANLEIEGVPPFWEDRLFTDQGDVVRFRVDDAELLGVTPCQRCVVPTRDPDTGAETPEFRARFVEHREATLPEWTACDRFDNPYHLMTLSHVPSESVGMAIEVGDTVERLGTRVE
jgi:uncharacterized protein YcbX